MLDDLVSLLYAGKPEELRLYLAEPKAGASQVKKFARFVTDMILVRGTDNFLTYVAELLALIFTARPETLKSSETVKLEEILDYSTMSDLIQRLAERRVERLSYQGMRDLQKDLLEKLNFEIFVSQELLARAVRIIENRNLVVHNRGIVNRTFQAKTGDRSVALGSALNLSPRLVVNDLLFLGDSVIEMDERASAKFGLPRSNNALRL